MATPTLREALSIKFNDVPSNFKDGSTTIGAIKDFFANHGYSCHKKGTVRPSSHFFVVLSHGAGLQYFDSVESCKLSLDEIALVFTPPA